MKKVLKLLIAIVVLLGLNATKISAESQGKQLLMLQANTPNKKEVKLYWNKVSGATKYEVYGNICGHSNTKKIATVKNKTKITIKKIGKKAIKKHTSYKFNVIAYKNNKKIASSRIIHINTANTIGKTANATSVKAKAKNIVYLYIKPVDDRILKLQ